MQRNRYNSFIPLVLIILLISISAIQASDDMLSGKVTSNVNFRIGPGNKHKIITTLEKDTEIKVFKSKGINGWLYVRVNKREGYIYKKYIKIISSQNMISPTTNATPSIQELYPPTTNATPSIQGKYPPTTNATPSIQEKYPPTTNATPSIQEKLNSMNLISIYIYIIKFIPPIIFLLISTYANRLSRKQDDRREGANDWAVATNLLIITLGIIFADAISEQIADYFFVVWFVIIFCLVLLSIDYDRHFSWNRDKQKRPLKNKRLYRGIIFPDLLSIFIHWIYQISKDFSV